MARALYQPTSEDAGRRLDQYVTSSLADVSRARVQQLIEQEKVTVNGKPERASYRILGGEEIELLGPAQLPPLKVTPEDIPLDVVYEDDSIAVIDKPAGMMVHAGARAAEDDEESDPRTRGTLVNALLHRFRKLSQEGGELRPGIVHRLDKETSGLIVVAKTDSAHRKLAEQFAGRVVKKKYVALVHGWPKSPTGTIRAAIGRDRSRRNRMSTKSRDGRDAVTHFNVRDQFATGYGKFALLDVTIETGRTHQIRVHLASIGHPVVGDTLYGAPAQLTLLPEAKPRALPKHTKATRDRAATERARKLTEAATGEANPRKRKGVQSQSRPTANLPVNLRLNRNFLHAAELGLLHPRTGKPLRCHSPLPAELAQFLESLMGRPA
ncbi:MAG: RluA family pseudouridine synthase [Acidobacteriales bacterium]|nr:RluA family pseudouridine synthase [Terriglobales bacterium]